MDKVEFELNSTASGLQNYFELRYRNGKVVLVVAKGDNLGRKLHIRPGDRFKVTIEKVKA